MFACGVCGGAPRLPDGIVLRAWSAPGGNLDVEGLCVPCDNWVNELLDDLGWSEDEPEPDVDDGVRCCPEFERPNQFGEKCPACEESERYEEREQYHP